MYRLAFIAKHGMRSYKDNSPQSEHHFSDEGLFGAALFGYFCLL
jgi:hypothetical protein